MNVHDACKKGRQHAAEERLVIVEVGRSAVETLLAAKTRQVASGERKRA